MVVALYVLAFAMILGGGSAAFEGYGIVLTERGWTMVIAGTVAATGGALLLGTAAVAGRLKRVERELTRLRERATRLGVEVPAPPPGFGAAAVDETGADASVERAVLKAADAIPEPLGEPARLAEEPRPAAPATEGRTVVGSYEAGGNAYVMYSDGSIEADTPNGRFRFTSLDELKDFIAGGGEEPPAARP